MINVHYSTMELHLPGHHAPVEAQRVGGSVRLPDVRLVEQHMALQIVAG